jgi:hypothetical protein
VASAYLQPEGFPGVETDGVPVLAGILLKGEEAQFAWDFGLTRVAALLGMRYHYYPCPTWSDPNREPVTSLRGMDKSIPGKRFSPESDPGATSISSEHRFSIQQHFLQAKLLEYSLLSDQADFGMDKLHAEFFSWTDRLRTGKCELKSILLNAVVH